MKKSSGLPVLYPNAAGIDIASREHFVAVNPAVDEHPIRAFGCFTEDLYAIGNWLIQCKVDTVAMEATGIYWVALYLILEDTGIKVVVVNAKHVKNVTGKKSDVKDAEWIRQLHSCGLLSSSFQPDASTRRLRCLMRHRKNLTEMAATHIRMMQKALEQMNIKLHTVISDITGKSGQSIIKQIIEGERSAKVLVELLDIRIKATRETVMKSLQGVWKQENLFELKQSFELYHIYRRKIEECDLEVRKHLIETSKLTNNESKVVKHARAKSNKNNLHFDATMVLQRIVGTDLTKIFGITDTNATEIISEVGLDMSKWPTAKHFTAWLNLAPNNRISGGKILSTKIAKKKNRAGQIFKLAAYAVQRSRNWLAMFYHRIKSRSGLKKAITATARKIAVIFYKLIKEQIAFDPIDVDKYLKIQQDGKLKSLTKQAGKLGLQLVPKEVVT